MGGETVNLRAESDWHKSLGDAEQECDDRLDEMEDEAIDEAESEGGEYVGGTTSGYDIEHDSDTDEFKCSAERTLNFIYPDDTKKDKAIHETIKEVSYDEYLKLKAEDSEPVVDVTGELRKLIAPLVPKTKEHTYYRRVSMPGPFGGGHMRIPMKVQLPLSSISFTNLTVISSNLELDDLAYTVNIPLNETVLHIPYRNCTPLQQSIKRDVEFKVTKGWKIEFSKRITSSTSIGGKLKFGKVGEASVEHKLTTEITNSKSISEVKEERTVTTFQYNIAANKIVDVKLTIQSFEAIRNFKGPITLEGTVIITYGKGEEKATKKLTDLLNETQRTIDISGYYANIDWQEMENILNSTDCPNL
ncbi:hypothetical protein J0X19_13565 [Hymenobacter sp. BT186]|uniref:Uncharacterized protein n=1 Tax=Hymenobacter telluris TaxID=2816474 RepID=A0A939EXJ2_9BACT|nr:hypothetical protein [Hymenobacter telluris]MBO0358981.1 hypothetical protein [Hymenobacter telluris]MBW3375007.1 hypothetical protein [Hymenobacter norwichensis]